MLHQNFVVGPFQCNCRLLACPRTGDALLIDPGDEPQKILRGLQAARTPSGQPIRVRMLLHTHGHLDHIGASRAVKESLAASAGALPATGLQAAPPPILALHRADEPLYQQLKTQGQMFGIEYDEPLPVDRYLEHEEEIRLGDLKFTVVHTPGHSPGSVCVRLHEDSTAGSRETLFSGDTLFHRSVGRTDLWGASADQMFKSIRERILTLDGDTRVCPGHGPDTSIAEEARENPFL
jgi:hydroxyacylglutathione hydrolase